jgi:hypothetical protein
MPFHEYAYYPGGMDALKRSYQPDFPPQTELRMGGTGLSGLALIEGQATMQMAVANPITSKVHTLAMHREAQGTPTGWRLEQLPDLITCDDPFFRPVALTNGPDGCIYIVDWYNKIISHNEVPRAHPDRDKTRGRIWRVRAAAPLPIPDFTALSIDELTAMLSEQPTARAHIAWQTLQDRKALPADHWADRDYQSTSPTSQIRQLSQSGQIEKLLAYAQPSLPGSLTQSSRGPKQIPTGPAYEREFQRFLVRMFLERQPQAVTAFLDSEPASKLPVEARVLASLALEPKTSAARVAKLLPQLHRAPNDEELLRLAQFPDEPGCGESLKALLANPAVAEKLLVHRTKLDSAKIAPLLTDAARSLLGSGSPLAIQLIGAFQLTALEPELVKATPTVATLSALRELRSESTDLFASLLKSPDTALANEALAALAASRNPKAPAQLIALYPTLTAAQQRSALTSLSATQGGAAAIVAAIKVKHLPATDLDGPAAERLSLVLGDDPELAALMASLGHVFREVLMFDGSEAAWIDSHIDLKGPFTVETWVKLAPGIGNEDSLLGSPGALELNFFQSKFRCYGGTELHDVAVSKKPITPDLWTHVAITRDAAGNVKLYQNGELDAVGTKPMPQPIKDCRIG